MPLLDKEGGIYAMITGAWTASSPHCRAVTSESSGWMHAADFNKSRRRSNVLEPRIYLSAGLNDEGGTRIV